MTELCETYFPADLKQARQELQDPNILRSSVKDRENLNVDEDEEEEEEEEE